MSELTICKVCDCIDTYQCNGDCSFCSECYSVEQGFLHLYAIEGLDHVYSDGDGDMYNEEGYFIGKELINAK